MIAFPGLAQSLGLLMFGLATMVGLLGLLGTLQLPFMVPVLASSVLGSLAALGLGLLVDRPPLRNALRLGRHTGAGWSALAPILLGALILASQLVSLTLLLWPPPAFFLKLMQQISGPGSTSERLLILLLAGVLGPVAEELLFRGLIQQGLVRRYGARSGIIAAALLFAVYHLNPWQGVAAFQLGLLLGWLTHRSGRIGYAVALHCANNLMALLVFDLVPGPAPGDMTAAGSGFLPPVVVLVSFVALAWGLYSFARSFPIPVQAPALAPGGGTGAGLP
ncbi:MAG: CPBP family intramembrane glutamic endopeptidase [Acidobacteriota bacterium]